MSKKETFDFSEALKRMKEGKTVKQQSRDRIFVIADGKIKSHSLKGGTFKEIPFFLNHEILATDWEETNECVKLPLKAYKLINFYT